MFAKISQELDQFLIDSILPQHPEAFVCIYGGSVYKHDTISDLDIFLYSDVISETHYQAFEAFVGGLHKKYSLSSDQEVANANKLTYDKSEAESALALNCFAVQDNRLHVNPVVKTKKFLASKEIKLRLFLNALTTPHVIIGNKTTARHFIHASQTSMTVVAIGLSDVPTITPASLVRALSFETNGLHGELFLGYKSEFDPVISEMYHMTSEGIRQLEAAGNLERNGTVWQLTTSFSELATNFTKARRDMSVLAPENVSRSRKMFQEAIDIGIDFKLNDKVRRQTIDSKTRDEFLHMPLPKKGRPLEEVMTTFREDVLPYCYNFASPNFMGFPDAGNSTAAITGSILSDFLQQNLINQSFCSPSATYLEIAVIGWLRSLLGYDHIKAEDIFTAGGIITGGGTTSNSIAMLLARERFRPNTMADGLHNHDSPSYLVVPKGIGHYSVKSGQMWIGGGNHLLEVPTKEFQYDLAELEKVLTTYKGKVMAIVAYAGDSRTMTIDNLNQIADLRDRIDPSIWLHADACHGFALAFSEKLKPKLSGIERFDSITTDPHKVLNIPYTISALLLKNPHDIKTISTTSDLIMQEQYAFGQVTPFIGSKPWISLKLWFALTNIGIEGYGKIIEARHNLALHLESLVAESKDFIAINSVHINSLAFMYVGEDISKRTDVEYLNSLNRDIHAYMLHKGDYHLHQFSIADNGVIEKGALIYPLRFMSGNPRTSEEHLRKLLDYIREVNTKLGDK